MSITSTSTSESIPHGSSIAVVGGGVSGIVSAFLAAQNHQVTLFEAANYLGGHTNTVILDQGPDAGVGIDTGFIVLNDQTYPNFHKFLHWLNVPVRFADMSFSYYCDETQLSYGSRNLAHLFCQKYNLIRPRFYQMLFGIFQFWQKANKALERGQLKGVTLGEFLKQAHIPQITIRDYILPMAGAIWSSPAEEMSLASAESIIHFCKNHGLLGLRNQPRWQTVVGGSHSYLRAFENNFKGKLLINTPISQIERSPQKVTIHAKGREAQNFDYVIIATHANHVLPLLASPSAKELELFSVWEYKNNQTVLHTDISHLPPLKQAWASWNYLRERNRRDLGSVPITYNMNILQGLALKETYCVTLNPERPIAPERVVKEIYYTHPVFSTAAIESQRLLNQHNGDQRTFFAGSYHGFGFHEDAVRSAVRVGAFFSGAL
jgi:predicted NAD/FAD-binding protein